MKKDLKKEIEQARPETEEEKQYKKLYHKFNVTADENGGAKLEGYSPKRITSKDGLVEFFGIDLNEWTIKTWQCGVYESHTRLRKYDGNKRSDDEHKVVPLYKISAVLVCVS